MRLKQNPFHLLLFAGLVFILTSFLGGQKETVDIHLHDTYFVIAQGYVSWLFAIIVWGFWLVYLLTRKWLFSKRLTWLHVILTLLTIMFLLFLLHNGSLSRPQQYLDYSHWNTFNGFNQNTQLTAYVILALLSGQIIFLINIIAGLLKQLR